MDTGWISQETCLPAVTTTGNSRVQALVSGSPATARKLADFHGSPEVLGHTYYDALLASDRIDAAAMAAHIVARASVSLASSVVSFRQSVRSA